MNEPRIPSNPNGIQPPPGVDPIGWNIDWWRNTWLKQNPDYNMNPGMGSPQGIGAPPPGVDPIGWNTDWWRNTWLKQNPDYNMNPGMGSPQTRYDINTPPPGVDPRGWSQSWWRNIWLQQHPEYAAQYQEAPQTQNMNPGMGSTETRYEQAPPIQGLLNRGNIAGTKNQPNMNPTLGGTQGYDDFDRDFLSYGGSIAPFQLSAQQYFNPINPLYKFLG